jgi:trehalose utilization protein
MNVLVWNEYSDEQKKGKIKEVYPEGLHTEIVNFLKKAGYNADYSIIEMPENGLSQEALDNTDVLIWWGHCMHDKVSDETVLRVINRVYAGMGIIFLHSSHMSKPFVRLMGTTCTLKWREASENERLWIVNPIHEITEGLNEKIEIEQDEMYGEYFDIPIPDELIFIGWFKGGEVFRSGVTYKRGLGKVFYFQPGHETYPVFKNKDIQKVIINAVKWAAPKTKYKKPECKMSIPNEII